MNRERPQLAEGCAVIGSPSLGYTFFSRGAGDVFSKGARDANFRRLRDHETDEKE
jgi:hypothetical protein